MRCCIHCLVPYMVYNHGMWFFQAEPNARVFDFSVFTLHAFVMEIFMFISGYFTMGDTAKLKDVSKRVISRLIMPSLLSAIITLPLLYGLQAYYKTGTCHLWDNVVTLFLVDVQQKGIPLAHYWYIFYVVIFTFLGCFVLPKKVSVAIALIVLGLLINHELMIRNPIYVEIKWPSFFYYLGYFLLGMSLRERNSFSSLGAWYKWAIVFVVSLLLSGAYIQAAMQGQALWGTVVLKPFFFGVCAFSGCVFFMRLMETWRFKVSEQQAASTYFFYLFHLPVAISCQMLFKLNGFSGFWVPLAVILLSVSLVHVAWMAVGKKFFALTNLLSIR